jgi:hypothetical protein
MVRIALRCLRPATNLGTSNTALFFRLTECESSSLASSSKFTTPLLARLQIMLTWEWESIPQWVIGTCPPLSKGFRRGNDFESRSARAGSRNASLLNF